MNNQIKIAFILDRAGQYNTPLLKKISQSSKFKLKVYFCSKIGYEKNYNKDFKETIKWDNTNLDGLDYHFLFNLLDKFESYFNPGIILKLKKHKFDYVIVHGYNSLTSLISIIFGKFFGSKIILRGETFPKEINNPKQKIKYFYLFRLIKYIDYFLYIGMKSKEFYNKQLKISNEKLIFHPYCVDNEKLNLFYMENRHKKNLLKNKLKLKNKFIFLYAAKFIKRKNPYELIDTFAKFKENQEIHLIMIGNGSEFIKCKNYLIKKNIKNVSLLGFKNQNELFKFYLIADVFVLPSSNEPWGLVVNEAMCFGLPIIASKDVLSHHDLINDGQNGLIFENKNFESLKEKLQIFISNKDLSKSMGEESLSIISKWNYDVCVNELVKVLQKNKI